MALDIETVQFDGGLRSYFTINARTDAGARTDPIKVILLAIAILPLVGACLSAYGFTESGLTNLFSDNSAAVYSIFTLSCLSLTGFVTAIFHKQRTVRAAEQHYQAHKNDSSPQIDNTDRDLRA